MNESSKHEPDAPRRRPRGWLRATVVGVLALGFVGAGLGFIAFLAQLRGSEERPARNADGIVVLTGGFDLRLRQLARLKEHQSRCQYGSSDKS